MAISYRKFLTSNFKSYGFSVWNDVLYSVILLGTNPNEAVQWAVQSWALGAFLETIRKEGSIKEPR